MGVPDIEKFNWTEEAFERVKKLARNGLSAAEISVEIGASRNAIIGKLHRAGLRGGGSTAPGRSPVRHARPGGGAHV